MVAVLVLPLPKLRPGITVLDADRAIPVRALSPAGLAQLRLSLVQAADRLAHATGCLHHACHRSAAGAVADRCILDRDRPSRLLRRPLFRGPCAARTGKLIRGAHARPPDAAPDDHWRVHRQWDLLPLYEYSYSDQRRTDAGAFSTH